MHQNIVVMETKVHCFDNHWNVRPFLEPFFKEIVCVVINRN